MCPQIVFDIQSPVNDYLDSLLGVDFAVTAVIMFLWVLNVLVHRVGNPSILLAGSTCSLPVGSSYVSFDFLLVIDGIYAILVSRKRVVVIWDYCEFLYEIEVFVAY